MAMTGSGQGRIPASEMAANLRRLVILRSLAIGAQVGVILIATLYLDLPLPYVALGSIVGGYTAFNLLAWWRLCLLEPPTESEAFGHLLVDVGVLTGLLYLTGGAANPFAFLFLLPLAIAATILPSGYTWALAGIAVACYSLVMVSFIPLASSRTPGDVFELHILGMWLGFVFSAGLIAYFVMRMGRALREREQELAAAREEALRDQQLVALGTLATSTAHELATPLSTIALLAEELEEGEETPSGERSAKIKTLREQVNRCKEAISGLSNSAGQVRLTGGSLVPVNQYLERLLSEWQDLHPEVQVCTTWHGCNPPPGILADRTLNQALSNLLANAAEASPERIDWEARWDPIELVMEIRDHGPGLTGEQQQKAGKTPFTEKESGLGLGLFLTYAIIERLGGKVTLFNREEGGLCTEICFPLTDHLGRTAG